MTDKVLTEEMILVKGKPSGPVPVEVSKIVVSLGTAGGTTSDDEGRELPTTTDLNGVPSDKVPIVVERLLFPETDDEGATPLGDPDGVKLPGITDVNGVPSDKVLVVVKERLPDPEG